MSLLFYPRETATPSGGVRCHFRHVEALRTLGYDARILTDNPDYKPPWFRTTAPMQYVHATAFDPKEDILVLSEQWGPTRVCPGIKKVMFNQNVHWTFMHYPIVPSPGMYVPYLDPDVLATVVVSEHNRAALAAAFPKHPITLIRHGLRPEDYPPPGEKKKQIAFMPRKNPDHAQCVFGCLRYMGALDGWDVVAIDGVDEEESLRILRESAVFFSFGTHEGDPLPPLEALASGCRVVGYGGYGGDEWIYKWGFQVSSGDMLWFVRVANEILRWAPWEHGVKTREEVLAAFAPAIFHAALEKFWAPLHKKKENV